MGLTAACSDAEPTPAAYFESLESETSIYAEAVDELEATYGEELSDELTTLFEGTEFSDTSSVDGYFNQAKEVAIVKTADLFSSMAAELRVLIDSLATLEPPEGLVEAHSDALAGGEELATAMPLTIEAVRNLESIEDLDETLEGTPYPVAVQRFGIACLNLETAARDQGITVELACPGADDTPPG
jgi:hypothetical protein